MLASAVGIMSPHSICEEGVCEGGVMETRGAGVPTGACARESSNKNMAAWSSDWGGSRVPNMSGAVVGHSKSVY